MVIDQEKLAKLQAASRQGGKGTPRRKVVKKPNKGPGNVEGDKKLSAALKKLNVQPLSGIEEVNMFKEDGNVLHFRAPKVHGVGASNTYCVYGEGADKELTDLVPGILNQLGPDSLNSLRKLAESYQAMNAAQQQNFAAGGKDDDEVPDVVENFDEAEKGDAKEEPEVEKLD
ncbi:probable transcription factor btf3a [Ceraceosorus bombacis]|uniref:Nascent polypeptide-associated complex subunit beta n=2 Tax=Ceraceosorus TaxID=401624 RepID=A0A0N7LBA9_9BASI|nr:NAC-domain-containing protein [Ceraceosorus guamensis]PWN43580.1 NAC-domain-containing protein [Ceraceosorus guamensis]CEH18874.1 probable transcription factor btf3a [Ceraceosorus bombacis]